MTNSETFVIRFNLAIPSYEFCNLDAVDLQNRDENILYWIHYNKSNHSEGNKIIQKLNLPKDVAHLFYNKELLTQMIEKEFSLTLQFHYLYQVKESLQETVRTSVMNIHLTQTYILTSSSGGSNQLQAILSNLQSSIHYAQTPCFVFFLILDQFISTYTQMLYKQEVSAEDFDITLEKESYQKVIQLKKEVMKVKRHIIIIMNILMYTSGRKISAISHACQKSLLLLLNNTHTLINETDSIRDMLNGIVDQLDNMLIREGNYTMKVLTAFASIFLPLTLIAGIYGMNFEWMPELSWKYGYPFALLLMVVCGGLLFYLFKRKRWF